MTNREFLGEKDNQQLAEWLGKQYEENVSHGEETDWGNYSFFQPSEFVCSCGACEYSKAEGVKNMNPNLLSALQFLRKYYGKPVKITCGARCKKYNDSLTGSVSNSKHMSLDAADFYIPGVTSTESGRDGVVKLLKALPKYNYAYHNKGGKYPNMGSAVHADFTR